VIRDNAERQGVDEGWREEDVGRDRGKEMLAAGGMAAVGNGNVVVLLLRDFTDRRRPCELLL